jgi:hypothetical protein
MGLILWSLECVCCSECVHALIILSIHSTYSDYFKVTWTSFKIPPLGGRPNTKPGDHGTPNAHTH